MYICVCKAVTDRQLTQVIDQGVCSRKELMQCTGAGSVCGKCSREIKQIFDNRQQGQPIMQAA